jgi:hypothetical protein
MTDMPINPGPTVLDVERIVAQTDPVIRNLEITQCYYELARPLVARMGGNANWCSFATWASKQAGQTIRREDLGRALERVLGTQEAVQQAAKDLAKALETIGARLKTRQILEFILKVIDPKAAFDLSSEAVARGNLKVFAEIGRAFAVFNAACLDDAAFDADKIHRICEELLPGEPPDGQVYLRQAFRHYYLAQFQEDPKARSELILLANLEIGYHEQTRLQPEINEALAAPIISPETFTRNLLRNLRPEWGGLNELIWFFMRLFGRLTDLDTAIAAYLAAAQREAQLIVTKAMMTIELPHGKLLRLGLDLGSEYPPALQQIGNQDLLALLARIDPTTDSPIESGAQYWGDLTDRLHFIVELFRCYQSSDELAEPPFTAIQAAELKDGRLPSGRL